MERYDVFYDMFCELSMDSMISMFNEWAKKYNSEFTIYTNDSKGISEMRNSVPHIAEEVLSKWNVGDLKEPYVIVNTFPCVHIKNVSASYLDEYIKSFLYKIYYSGVYSNYIDMESYDNPFGSFDLFLAVECAEEYGYEKIKSRLSKAIGDPRYDLDWEELYDKKNTVWEFPVKYSIKISFTPGNCDTYNVTLVGNGNNPGEAKVTFNAETCTYDHDENGMADAVMCLIEKFVEEYV